MKYASVCSGVEAASLAWMPLGWDAAWFSEIEPFPCAVLKERFPDVPNLGDMTKITVENLENGKQKFTGESGADVVVPGGIDLLVGGTPCQDASVAGKRAGLVEGSRSRLAFDFTRIAYESKAKWLVWENVPGVFSLNKGEDFAAFLSSLAGWDVAVPDGGWKNAGIVRNATDGNFGLAYRVLDAQYVRVDGFPRAIPQRRRRVFVVGCLGDWQRAAEVLFESEGVSWNTPPRRIKGERFTSNPKGCAESESKFWNGNDYAETIKANCDRDRMPDKQKLNCVIEMPKSVSSSTGGQFNDSDGTELAHTLEASNSSHPQGVLQYGECAGTLTSRHDSSPCADRGQNVICAYETGQGFWQSGDNAGTLRAEGENRPSRPSNIVYDARGNGDGNIAPTITGNHENRITDYTAIAIAENVINRKSENGGNGIGAQTKLAYTQNATGVMAVSKNATIRRLLPIECERLMGFPDNWTKIQWKGKSAEECPDSPRYKACGNSMCVNVMRWIGMRIEILERKLKNA